jgi:penicillin-binding protein 1A
MGRAETGSQAALPIWIRFMASALKTIPQTGWATPPGVVTVTIDPLTGLRLPEGTEGLVEHFYEESAPEDSTIGGDDGFPGFPGPDESSPTVQPGTPI